MEIFRYRSVKMPDLLMLSSSIFFPAQQYTWNAVVEGRGLELTFIGMLVVFTGLVILAVILNYLERIISGVKNLGNLLSGTNKESTCTEDLRKTNANLTGEEAAAICSAIVLYHRLHMSDSRQVLTVRSELKQMSPWSLSGKIHPTRRVV
jgi:Na+-transporting methylmalonyl-CoA/oxaloacetate decarboxylase gamma subunit